MRSTGFHSRRFFLASLSALSATGLIPASVSPALDRASDAAGSKSPLSGLVPAGDWLFSSGLIYLQTGSLGPTPRPVMERVIAEWKELELNPAAGGYGNLVREMDDVRAKGAALLGCRTEEIVLTTSTTDGMNRVAEGLGLAAGDRVLTTDQEHPGGRACWDYVARRQGVVIDTVRISPGDHDAGSIVDRFSRAITPRTRVLSFSHILSSTGLRMPVADLSALGRKRGAIVVVDGAQAAGGVQVDVGQLGCHVYVTSGHKWLLGPKGTGLLSLSNDLAGAVDPIALQCGRGAYSESSGVGNIPGVIGLGAAIDYLEAIGISKVEAHNLALRNRLDARLRAVPGLRVVSAPPGPLASPLLTFALPDDVDSRGLAGRLSTNHQIVVKIVPKEWLNGLRISTHLFNSEADVDRLLEALEAERG